MKGKRILNNKGFTFVEILAVIVVIGILTSIAVVGVSRYKDKTRQQDYDALAKASYNAMEEYLSDHPFKNNKVIPLSDLYQQQYLSTLEDPGNKGNNCRGSIIVNKNNTSSGSGSISDYTYSVYLCCSNYVKLYDFPGDGKAKDLTAGTDPDDVCDADADEDSTEASFTDVEITAADEIKCLPGKYLPKNTTSCKTCLAGSFCGGGTFSFSTEQDQGIELCNKTGNAPGYDHSEEGSDEVNDCFMRVPENHFVNNSKDDEATVCPVGTNKAVHDVFFEDVSVCTSSILTCEAGKYLPKGQLSCSVCKNNNYCPGGDFLYNASEDQGIIPCSAGAPGYTNSAEGSKEPAECYMNVPKDYFVDKSKDSSATHCPERYEKDAHSVYFGGVSSCSKINETTYNITYDLGGGVVAAGNPTTYSASELPITLNNPQLDYYQFKGWTGSNGTTPQTTVTLGTSQTGDLHFVANYEKLKVRVVYNCQGGTLFASNYDPPLNPNWNKYEVGVPDQKLKANACTRKGYTLIGWDSYPGSTDENVEFDVDYDIDDDWINDHAPEVNIYARWVLNAPGISDVSNPYFDTTCDDKNDPDCYRWTNASTSDYKLTLKADEYFDENYVPDEDLGSWYYTYDGDWTRYSSSVGTSTFVTTPFSADRDESVYFMLCNRNISESDDVNSLDTEIIEDNCSSASSYIRIEKNPPTLKFKSEVDASTMTEDEGWFSTDLRDHPTRVKDFPFTTGEGKEIGASGFDYMEAQVVTYDRNKNLMCDSKGSGTNIWKKLEGNLCDDEDNSNTKYALYGYRAKDIAGNRSKIVCVYCFSEDGRKNCSLVNDNIYNANYCELNGIEVNGGSYTFYP